MLVTSEPTPVIILPSAPPVSGDSFNRVNLHVILQKITLDICSGVAAISMSNPDPPWKKRTRPCPFYSQGRCVFTESCGFLHDVKIKSFVDQERTSSPLDAESSRTSVSSMGSIVRAPLAVAAHSPTSSPFPARSPRMASLLSALQGIIEPLSPEKEEFSPPQADVMSSDAASDASHVSSLSSDVVQGIRRVSNGGLDTAPVPAVDIPPADSVTPPGLLSPVLIGSVPPLPFTHVASSATLSRGDSIDSGYAETWVGPTPFSLSPPHLNQMSSTLDLLSSPFGSPQSRVLPRRFSPSPTRRPTSPPAPRDSIDIVSPTLSTIVLQNTSPSHGLSSPGSINLVYATPVQQCPLPTSPSEQGGAEVPSPTSEIFSESDPHLGLSVGSPAETLFFPLPPSGIPIPRHPAHVASYESLVDPQHSVDNTLRSHSPSKRDEDTRSTVEGTAETSPVSEQFSLAEPGCDGPLPSPLPSMDATMPCPLGATLSPRSVETTAVVGELDYEVLYQSLVKSPEEAAPKRMSWASRPSPPNMPPRAASAGNPSAAYPPSALVEIPERPHSAVDLPPWSRQWGLRVTPVLTSEYTSRTSSPPLETPMSSGSSRVDASMPSVHASPVSLSASDSLAHSPSTSAPRQSRRLTGNLSPRSAPGSTPSREVTSTLTDRSDAEPRSRWNRVSTSRKVPFGFRHSLAVDRGRPPALAPGTRKRPSVLTSLPPVPFIEPYETPDSARSFFSEPLQSKPSWARPLHLSRPSETVSPIHRPDSQKEFIPSASSTCSSSSYSQYHSLASSSSPVHSLVNSTIPFSRNITPRIHPYMTPYNLLHYPMQKHGITHPTAILNLISATHVQRVPSRRHVLTTKPRTARISFAPLPEDQYLFP
ncbi:hypothetical protein BC826DRAFT_275618 [Russula brevipes]|nr:hypothetical protein BC826DRAFT_275618 [Russula brevipes]